MSEEIPNKIKTFVIEYPDSTIHMIPLDKITGLLKKGDAYFIQASGRQEVEISSAAFKELEKYFEAVIIETRE